MVQLDDMFDPTGAADQVGADRSLAERPKSLEGLTVGLLDNTKANSAILLADIAERLKADHGIGEVKPYVKDYFGTPVKDELFEKIVGECDVVITAVGDCGSCSAATVADGIKFERAGIPTASICSDSFLPSGRAMAEVQGYADYDFVTVEHPVASLDADQLTGRAQEALPQVLRILGAAA